MKPLFWIDLEMTGLDEKTDKILEIAVVITDEELNSREEYHRVVFQPKEILDTMNDWCKKTHGESGLTAAVPNGLPIEQIDDELISLISRHFAVDDRIILCWKRPALYPSVSSSVY
jgi:oligoribonuclease